MIINAQQYISVDTSTFTADQLVKDIFIGAQNASCITISNVTVKGGQDYQGNPVSYGYFEKGTLPFNIDKGIILSTGRAAQAPGPNTNVLSEGGYDWVGDPDLVTAFQDPQYINATSLEFDFVAYNTTGISFQYMLLSEEYQTSGCNYFDSFAFLIKEAGSSTYKNIALVPGTDEPVSSQTVRGGTDCPRNEMYFDRFNYPPDSPRLDSPTNYDGQTKVLTAKTDIIPGKLYHIKLVIADYKTTSHDSAVFLKAGSFVGKKDLGPDLVISSNNALCDGTDKTLDATTPGATSYQWYKDEILLTGETNPLLTIPGNITSNGNYEVEIKTSGCELKGSINIEFAEKPIASEKKFCNYNNGLPIPIDLQGLNPQFISNYKNYFKVDYFEDSTHQKPLPNNWSYLNDVTIYAEITSGTCQVVNETVHLNTPKKSAGLDNQTICANAETELEAETGYKNYKWMREDGSIISDGTINIIKNIPVGKYTVELTSKNDCKLIQEVEVFAAELPKITNIDVNGSTATVFVTGGNPPYEYSLDNSSFQSSNIFTNIPRGLHTMYVRDSINCEIIEKEFLIINLINVITPNGDGQNDYLDYSDLSIKKDVKIEIFDRFGSRVFLSNNNQFIWDGKTMNGRPLSTGNYWFLLSWIEPDTNLPVSYNGWILLKNRN